MRYLRWFAENIDSIAPPLRTTLYYCLGLLPAQEQPPRPEWANVLQLPDPIETADVKRAYRTLAKQYHPDTGGSAELMQRLNAARAEAEQFIHRR